MAKGVGLRLLSRRGSWVQIPPSAPQIQACLELNNSKYTYILTIGAKPYAGAKKAYRNLLVKINCKLFLSFDGHCVFKPNSRNRFLGRNVSSPFHNSPL